MCHKFSLINPSAVLQLYFIAQITDEKRKIVEMCCWVQSLRTFSLPVEEVCLLVNNANSPPRGLLWGRGTLEEEEGLSGGSD